MEGDQPRAYFPTTSAVPTGQKLGWRYLDRWLPAVHYSRDALRDYCPRSEIIPSGKWIPEWVDQEFEVMELMSAHDVELAEQMCAAAARSAAMSSFEQVSKATYNRQLGAKVVKGATITAAEFGPSSRTQFTDPVHCGGNWCDAKTILIGYYRIDVVHPEVNGQPHYTKPAHNKRIQPNGCQWVDYKVPEVHLFYDPDEVGWCLAWRHAREPIFHSGCSSVEQWLQRKSSVDLAALASWPVLDERELIDEGWSAASSDFSCAMLFETAGSLPLEDRANGYPIQTDFARALDPTIYSAWQLRDSEESGRLVGGRYGFGASWCKLRME
jgi:hypothetical protein